MVIQNTTPLPTMDELDTPSTIGELRKPIEIDSLYCGKAPGSTKERAMRENTGRPQRAPQQYEEELPPVTGFHQRW